MRSMKTSLAVAALLAAGALATPIEPVEEIVATREPKRDGAPIRRSRPPPAHDQPPTPMSRQHRRAMERAARKRRPTTQGEKTND